MWASESPEQEVVSNCSHSGCVEWSCQLGEKGWVKAEGESWSTSVLVGSRDFNRSSALSDQYLGDEWSAGLRRTRGW